MKNRKLIPWIETMLTVAIISAAILLLGRNFYFFDNNLYPNTTDALPVYSMVEYLAKHILSFKWPLFFPYWYSSCALLQHCSPLSVLILLPFEIILKNPTASLKIYYFISLFAAGTGSWLLARKYTGKLYALIAALIYVLQPYFMVAFYGWGRLEIMPIVALAPFYVTLFLGYYKNPKIKTWLLIVAVAALLMLSSFTISLIMSILMLLVMAAAEAAHKKAVTLSVLCTLAVVISAGLIAIYWMPALLESPDLPFYLPEIVKAQSASLSWFIPGSKNIANAYFSITILIFSSACFYFAAKKPNTSYRFCTYRL